MPLDRTQATLKTGQEQLIFNDKALNFSLLDFWRWSVSDILSNVTRGRFAEFIVATATNIDITKCRDEWSAFDLKTPEGIKLEIKSAAYLQSWFQRKLSKISFGTKPALYWDASTNQFSKESTRHADVYVFCLLYHQNKQTVDPLNLTQWEFYVLTCTELNNSPYHRSITLESLKKLTIPVFYDSLYDEIKKKINMAAPRII